MAASPTADEADRRIITADIVKLSGLDAQTLLRVAAELRLPERFAEMQTDTIVVDFIPAVAEQAMVREDDLPPGQPVLIRPVEITYRLENQMFGGETYVALTADGHVLARPIKWVSYEHFGNYILGNK